MPLFYAFTEQCFDGKQELICHFTDNRWQNDSVKGSNSLRGEKRTIFKLEAANNCA
jgi:hypothetical protein